MDEDFADGKVPLVPLVPIVPFVPFVPFEVQSVPDPEALRKLAFERRRKSLNSLKKGIMKRWEETVRMTFS